MKKIITSILAFAMLASAAPVQAKVKGEDVLAVIIAGIIVNEALSDDDHRDRRNYRRYDRYSRTDWDRRDDYYRDDPYEYDRYTMPRTPRYYERYCVTEQMVDRRGRVYFRRTCQ